MNTRSSKAVAAHMVLERTMRRNCTAVASPNARLVIRFGAITDRKLDPRELVKTSLAGTGWRLLTGRNAGTASGGRRQANHFSPEDSTPALAEYDLWAEKTNLPS